MIIPHYTVRWDTAYIHVCSSPDPSLRFAEVGPACETSQYHRPCTCRILGNEAKSPHSQAPQLQNASMWGESASCEHDVFGKGPEFSEWKDICTLSNQLYVQRLVCMITHQIHAVSLPSFLFLFGYAHVQSKPFHPLSTLDIAHMRKDTRLSPPAPFASRNY